MGHYLEYIQEQMQIPKVTIFELRITYLCLRAHNLRISEIIFLGGLHLFIFCPG